MKNRPGSIVATIILIAIVIFLAADVGFSLYSPNRLDATLPVCTLNIINGDIKVQTKDGLTWEKAVDGMILEPGSRVRTATDAQASLIFSEGTTTKLEPGTDLIVAKLEGSQDTQPDTVILKHLSGKTWNQVTRRPDESYHFQIQTSSADIKVRGTLFATEVDESGKTLVKTTEGCVSVTAQGREVLVNAGQQTEVEPGAAPSVPTPIPPAKNELVFTVSEPAFGLVTDPSGASTGYLPDGVPVNQISGSSLSSPEEPYHTIRIPEPDAGEYAVALSGVEDGSSSVSVEGFSEGKSIFSFAESGNITAAEELVLKLHLDVLDGLMQVTKAFGHEPVDSQPEPVTAVLKKAGTEPEYSKSPQKSLDSDVEKQAASKEGEIPGEKIAWFRPEDADNEYNQWFIPISFMVLFAIASLVVLRKH